MDKSLTDDISPKPELIGHRGVMAEVPQNTLESISRALELGANAIEFDTQITKTGEVVLFHDSDVKKITRGQAQGPVNSFSLKEIKKLNVHDGFNDGHFYQIPTLEQTL